MKLISFCRQVAVILRFAAGMISIGLTVAVQANPMVYVVTSND
jgi:hypothetical protein